VKLNLVNQLKSKQINNKLKISAIVTLKKDVLDPQGKIVSQTLKDMGYNNVISIRQGKFFDIELDETNKEKAKEVAEEICKKLLTNIVIEDYTISLE
jgi:phosphoribosylformylglycinamidine synthase PurS subunit